MGDTLKPFRDLVKLRTLHLSFNEIASLPPKFTAGSAGSRTSASLGIRFPSRQGPPRGRGQPYAYISDAQHGQGIFEVVHQFPDEENMSAFALFQPIPSSKYEATQSGSRWALRDRFVDTLTTHLKDTASGRIADASV
ncbi:hypothetical protein BD779DRAFT_1680835 [Infundibulicybe gibba]|nr:hypothetical protein BD779DRAFT_1680835 [Infundibulicybe gibba]